MKYLILEIAFALISNQCFAQPIQLQPQEMDLINIRISNSNYKGKNGVKIIGTDFNKEEMAILKKVTFVNGIIEVDVSGDRLAGSDVNFRGFIGLAFRVQQIDTLRFECFYLRPTNSRAEDQFRRNHSVQYFAAPNYPWQRLRKESPGVYESYVDMIPGEWTHIKIIVKDKKASLFVNYADQPCLIVTDLKNGASVGTLALWIGPGTEGYFSGLKVSNMN